MTFIPIPLPKKVRLASCFTHLLYKIGHGHGYACHSPRSADGNSKTGFLKTAPAFIYMSQCLCCHHEILQRLSLESVEITGHTHCQARRQSWRSCKHSSDGSSLYRCASTARLGTSDVPIWVASPLPSDTRTRSKQEDKAGGAASTAQTALPCTDVHRQRALALPMSLSGYHRRCLQTPGSAFK